MRDLFTPRWLRCAALAGAFALLVALGRATLPSVGHGTATVDGRAIDPGDLPVFVPGKDLRRLEASFALEVPFFRPRSMVVVPDDCVERIAMNGVDLPMGGAGVQTPLGSCVYGNRVVGIASAVHRGANDVDIVVGNRRGRTALDVAVRSGLAYAVFGLALLALLAGMIGLARRRPWSPIDRAVGGVLLAAMALRTVYVLGTPSTVRGHDADKHLEYIRYVADHWRPPPPHAGFEFYQPPLYYALMAPLLRLGTLTGAALSDTLFHLQLFSLLLSAVALWIGLGTLRSLLRRSPKGGDPDAERGDVIVAGSILAVFPALVYFAARINNDVLVQVTSFAGVAFVVQFWRSGRTAPFVAFAACVATGLLTKSNTYVVLALGLVCLVTRRGIDLWQKALLGARLAAIVGLLSGWFVVRRFLQERGTQGLLVSNASWLNHNNALPNTFDALFGFHPLEMLGCPFNGSTNPLPGRQLWPYFIRSSLFGEFGFGPRFLVVARVLLVLLALLAIIAARGWWSSARARPWQGRPDWPMHVLLVGSLASHLAFRVVSAWVPSQDFRYSFLLLLPFAYFVALGLRDLASWPRRVAMAVCGAFVASSAGLIIALWLVVVT